MTCHRICNDFEADPSNSRSCINRSCSTSSHKNTYNLSECISQVEITNECSSQMMKKIDNLFLKPNLFKLPGEDWKKV
jgi:hypothetical protein